MRHIIIFISLILLFSCKIENKKEVEKSIQKIINETSKTDDTINRDIKKKKEQKNNIDELNQRKLDYSLKIKEVKTQKDSVLFLKHYFNQFKKENDSLSEILFFKMFPDTFDKFKNIYGYDDKDNNNVVYGLLYNDYHIMEYKLNYIKLEKYIKKIINISINGFWESDNVSILQDRINKLFSQNSNLFVEILKTKDDSEVESFWKFFFDGPHPENQKELYNKVLSKLKEVDEAMIPTVKRAYAKVKEDWSEH